MGRLRPAQDNAKFTGYLVVNVQEEEAKQILADMRARNLHAWLVPISYRDAPITFDQAQMLANNYVHHTAALQAPKLQFDPAQFGRSIATCWMFFAESPTLIEQVYVPAAIYVYVDKVDGHIWESEERNRFDTDINFWDNVNSSDVSNDR